MLHSICALAEMGAGMRGSADRAKASCVLIPSRVLRSGLSLGKRDATSGSLPLTINPQGLLT